MSFKTCFSGTFLAECLRQSELFRPKWRNPLKGCVSALNGLAIKIRRPWLSDEPNSTEYYNRKCFFAVNVRNAVGPTSSSSLLR